MNLVKKMEHFNRMVACMHYHGHTRSCQDYQPLLRPGAISRAFGDSVPQSLAVVGTPFLCLLLWAQFAINAKPCRILSRYRGPKNIGQYFLVLSKVQIPEETFMYTFMLGLKLRSTNP